LTLPELANVIIPTGLKDVRHASGRERRRSDQGLRVNQQGGLLFYTDGLTDVLDPQGSFSGLEQLDQIIARHQKLELEDLCQAIFSELALFQGAGDQFDDMTLLALAVEGPPFTAPQAHERQR
jgi:phosphoserine phosphatase RsbU/P